MKNKLISILILFCFQFQLQAHDTDSITIVRNLAELEQDISFPYNNALEHSILSFSNKALPYSFLLFEKCYETENKANELPSELKYLPMSLSLMDNNYRQGDRCGIWALPTFVAIRYGLTVDANHDERFSIEASTKAAMQYLSDLYAVFGDWWKCILAYTNSPASVQAATLRHSDSEIKLWDYYKQESIAHPEIIGNFMACNYVYRNAEKAIKGNNSTQVCFPFDHPIALSLLSERTGLSETEIKVLNPIFRSDPIMPKEGYPLQLPEDAIRKLAGQEEALYKETAMLVFEKNKKEAEAKAIAEAEKKEPTYHTVKSGDVLGKIADRYNVSVSELKEWNHLKNDVIRIGQELIVSKSGGKPTKASVQETVSTQDNKMTHTVKLGETLGGIAEKYKVSVSDIKKWNNLKNDMIREKQRLIIYNKAS